MSGQQPHIVPLKIYFGVFMALMGGTAATVYVAFHDFGAFNTPIALAIACIKATAVVLFFMHVRWNSRVTWLFAAAGFVWLLILFAFTLSDYYSRPWMPIYG